MVGNRPYSHSVLDIYIPVVPIENCLRVTHSQRQKTLKSLQSYYSTIF